jgi:endonuclease/exonuclease/phosphatase family metal-dependent hydrolase
MKGVPLLAGGVVAALLVPIIAVASIAGVVTSTQSAATCVDASVTTTGSWRPPLKGSYLVTSRYGVRFHPVLHTTKLHTGIDLVAQDAPTVIAAAAGTVETSDYNAAYGNQVVVDHGGGIKTRYGHMASKSQVAIGQRVTGGTTLGVQGATGYVTGVHLHFEVIQDGRPIDPTPFMANHGATLNGKAGQSAPDRSATPITTARTDGRRITLSSDQLANASVISKVGHAVGAGDQGVLVALVAALQESGLKNLSYGDHDSLGLFQQLAGWGTARQRQEPEYAARAFFGGPDGPNRSRPAGLLDVKGWKALSPGAAAQAVQVSAFPDAYDAWEPVARAILGHQVADPSTIGCANSSRSPSQVRVATWNLCLEFCSGGKLRPWRERVPEIAAVLVKQHPDVISLQETGQIDLHGAAIIAALAPTYKLAAYERSKMILFDPSRFSTRSTDGRRLGSAEFVIHGKGGVAQVLRNKETGSLIVISSLHPVDGNDEQRRLRYIERADAEVRNLARARQGSIIVHAGDLNSRVPGSPVATFFADRGLRSAEQVAKSRTGQEYASYNGGRVPRRGYRIDHVMIDPSQAVVDDWQQVLSDRRDSPETDHHLISVDLTISIESVPTAGQP